MDVLVKPVMALSNRSLFLSQAELYPKVVDDGFLVGRDVPS
jgi:hypothetical protein